MSMKKFQNIFSRITSIVLIFTLIMPVGAASQSTPEPMYDLLVYDKTTSINTDTGARGEVKYSGYKTATKSFIFNDNNLVPHVVKVYDNHGSTKLPLGDTTVRLRRYGQLNSGIVTYLDGKKVVVSGVGSGVVSSYPNTFISNEVYTFKERDIDPDAPYSIFTASAVSTPNALNNNKSTRYEVNIYIYWEHPGYADAPKVSFKYDPSNKMMVLSGVCLLYTSDAADEYWFV